MAVLGKPSQDFIPINDVRDGVIILNNGDFRMILMTSSLNFGLKSSDEQAAILKLPELSRVSHPDLHSVKTPRYQAIHQTPRGQGEAPTH